MSGIVVDDIIIIVKEKQVLHREQKGVNHEGVNRKADKRVRKVCHNL